uniref:Glycosyltransferase 61 catalytic domain-containing protein n=1 Tax=Oryza rufipogon TaxID=4529 RepID=A0A0E0MQP0_ORYRU
MEGGGKAGYSYGGHHHHQDAKLLKNLSRVEPRRFGLGLVAGFLIVTCAYFSTAKFDAIHIAMISSPAKNAAGFMNASSDGSNQQQLDLDRDAMSREGSKAQVLDTDGDDKISSLGPDLGHNASALEGKKKDETFAKDSGDASVSASTDEALAKDDDAIVGAVLPPLSSEEPTNITQDSVLEDEELKVQETAPATTNPSPEKSSNNGSSPSVVPSDPATLPVQQIPPTQEAKDPPAQQIPAVPEAKVPPVQQIPTFPVVKTDSEAAPRRKEWKPLCDLWSNRRIDWCELDGDVRVAGANGTVSLVAPPGPADERTFRAESWHIKPYPRKADPNAMRHVRVLTVQSLPAPAASAAAPACTERHDVPGLVFSDRGYTGNYFHAYTDVILPLFLTARQYSGEVKLLVSDFQMWWLGKFLPVFKAVSNYDLINLGDDRRVHCFRHVQVGLTCHADFSIDPSRAPNGYSMVDFTRFMRATYRLPRDAPFPASGEQQPRRPWRPRLLVIARARTRRFVNADEIVRGAERAGFEVVVSEGEHEVAPFAELANTCDAMVGVHGAGLTNMVFLPTGGVVIQVVPLGGLEFVAGYFRGPSRDMGLRYLEYRITPEESTLIDQYPRDHPIFTDPDGVKSKGWNSLKEAYLDKQDVRLDMKRFRPILKKAIAHLRKNSGNNNTTHN